MDPSRVLIADAGEMLAKLSSFTKVGGVCWVSVIALAISLACWLPNGKLPSVFRRVLGTVAGVIGLTCLWWAIPSFGTLSQQATFWCMAALTIASAVATISARNPVYSAIWFAVSLLGTAALFFLQNAQFLGIATVAVYAGAIVVTFLFVLMLSQPTGHAFYDRISWGRWPRMATALAAALMVALISGMVAGTDREQLTAREQQMTAVQETLIGELATLEVRSLRYESDIKTGTRRAVLSVRVAPAELAALREQRADLEKLALARLQEVTPDQATKELRLNWDDLQTNAHMAQLGGRLFSRQWISIQAAGALLMAALVGAVAIASRDGAGKTE